MFDLPITISAVPAVEAGVGINLPHALVSELAAMSEGHEEYNICEVCHFEVAPCEPCRCGILGGLKMNDIDKRARQMVEQAAVVVAALPVSQWSRWVIYLLEALDAKSPEQQFRGCLDTLLDALLNRAYLGRW